MEFPGKQMRDWQRNLANDAAETVETVADTKTTGLPPQIVWSLSVFTLVFVVLAILKPPFVESAEREKPLEPRRTQWGIVFVTAAAAGGLVLLGSSFYE